MSTVIEGLTPEQLHALIGEKEIIIRQLTVHIQKLEAELEKPKETETS